jgi:hypothetical protein
MRGLIQIGCFLAVLFSMEVFSCSIGVTDNYEKNYLMGHAANHFRVSLADVTDLRIENYSRHVEEEDPESMCPLFLNTTGKVSFKYSPNRLKTCRASVVVLSKQYIWEPNPSIPFLQLDFQEKSESCVTSLPRPAPLPRPCVPGINCH